MDEGFDMSGDGGGGDIGADLGGDVGGDFGGDFGGDLADDAGADLSADLDVDVGTDVESDLGDDLGQDLNSNDVGESADAGVNVDTVEDVDADMDAELSDDLSVDSDPDVGDDLNADSTDGISEDVPVEGDVPDSVGEGLNDSEADDIPEADSDFGGDVEGDTEPDAADDTGMDLNGEADDLPLTETENTDSVDIGEDLNEEPESETNSADIHEDGLTDIVQGKLDKSDGMGDNVDGEMETSSEDVKKPPSVDSETVDPHDLPDEYGSSFNERLKQTPVNNGEWSGERGDSEWVPETEDVAEKLESYGVDGIEYHDGFPDFSPVTEYEHQLSDDLYESNDSAQFNDCNDGLSSYLNEHPDLGEHFDEDQLEAIQAGEKPSGYTWHHDVEPGKMQLVPTRIHQSCGHYGGKNVWGGGTDNR